MMRWIQAIWTGALAISMVSSGNASEKTKTPGAGGWTKLCNGRNLDGWEKVNTGGTWTVENGIIIARREPPDRGASWLVSKRDYGDFILRLKYKSATERYNSGILIRDPAHAKLLRPAFNGFEVIIAQGQKDENTNAAIYYEANAFTQPLHAADWADFEVSCIGDHIITYMNGKKMAETHSRRSFKGGIGLHLHGGDEPAENWWKDIEIKELPPASRPFQLMQEKMEQDAGEFAPVLTADSLEHDFKRYGDPSAAWSIDQNILKGRSGAEESWIAGQRSYGNFVLTFDVKLDSPGSGGAGFRIPAGDRDFAERGYELAFDPDDARNPPGSVYNLARAFVLDPTLHSVYHAGQWNRVRIYAMRDHLITYVNLTKTSETHTQRSARGRIAFRAGPGASVKYRDIKIKEIAPSENDANRHR